MKVKFISYCMLTLIFMHNQICGMSMLIKKDPYSHEALVASIKNSDKKSFDQLFSQKYTDVAKNNKIAKSRIDSFHTSATRAHTKIKAEHEDATPINTEKLGQGGLSMVSGLVALVGLKCVISCATADKFAQWLLAGLAREHTPAYLFVKASSTPIIAVPLACGLAYGSYRGFKSAITNFKIGLDYKKYTGQKLEDAAAILDTINQAKSA